MTRRPRVLVIDDDPVALQVTTAQLTPENYEVVCEDGG